VKKNPVIYAFTWFLNVQIEKQEEKVLYKFKCVKSMMTTTDR